MSKALNGAEKKISSARRPAYKERSIQRIKAPEIQSFPTKSMRKHQHDS